MIILIFLTIAIFSCETKEIETVIENNTYWSKPDTSLYYTDGIRTINMDADTIIYINLPEYYDGLNVRHIKVHFYKGFQSGLLNFRIVTSDTNKTFYWKQKCKDLELYNAKLRSLAIELVDEIIGNN